MKKKIPKDETIVFLHNKIKWNDKQSNAINILLLDNQWQYDIKSKK